MEYELKGKGVFVIIRLSRHNFSGDWKPLVALDYVTDEKNLLKAFNLTEQSPNLLLKVDLTHEAGQHNFDDFMDTFQKQLVAKDAANENPSFVFFVLMSHGLGNGGFFLSTPKSAHRSPPCPCEGGHVGTGKCYIRYVTKNIMDKLQRLKQYDGVPKIVILQTCRGSEKNLIDLRAAELKASSSRDVPSETELFILKYTDTFLLHPCVEGDSSWVRPRFGSFLIESLYFAIEELRRDANKHAENMERLQRLKQPGTQPDPIDKLIKRLSPENTQSGWWTNVCQRAASLAANKMVTLNFVNEDGTRTSEAPLDKQQPHFSSSLGYKLSLLKILKTQWAEKDSYLDAWHNEMIAKKIHPDSDDSDEYTDAADGFDQ